MISDSHIDFEFINLNAVAILSTILRRKHTFINSTINACNNSKTLDKAHHNYTIMEEELLAMAFGLEKFRSYLLGSHVIIYLDHTTVGHLLGKKDAKSRLIR
jgi:hypothetical protein